MNPKGWFVPAIQILPVWRCASCVVAPQPARILSYIVRSPLPRAIAPQELVLYGMKLGVELLHKM